MVQIWGVIHLEAPPRIELGIEVLQTCALPLGHGTEYLGHDFNRAHFVERITGLEPATSTLARSRSTK